MIEHNMQLTPEDGIAFEGATVGLFVGELVRLGWEEGCAEGCELGCAEGWEEG